MAITKGSQHKFTKKSTDASVPAISRPGSAFTAHNHDGTNGESSVLSPTQLFIGGVDITSLLVPIGTIIPFYDFGSLSFDTDIWKHCDGSNVTDPTSPLFGQTTPDVSGRYLVGFGTEGGGDIDSATFSSTPVGLDGHVFNNEHRHREPSPGHTHGAGSMRFKWYEYHNPGGKFDPLQSRTWQQNGTQRTDYIIRECLWEGSSGLECVLGLGSGAELGMGGGDIPFWTQRDSGVGSTDETRPYMDYRQSSAQTIQPKSIKVRFLMRVK
jgi:hypothetical protein